MGNKDIMDTETINEPATIDQGREPPAGSRGETGQKPADMVEPATPIEDDAFTDWECMSCGSVYKDPVNPCPKCGGSIRKVGIAAKPVYAEQLAPGNGAVPKSGDNAQTSPRPEARKSATIADLSARGEDRTPPPSADDPNSPQNTPSGGDHRLQGERVHPTDAGSSGGGGGTGA